MHVAIVTGANHGIGAAAARALAARGVAVLCTYLRLRDGGVAEAGVTTERYHSDRAATADEVVAGIRRAGGRAAAFEADLSDPDAPRAVFDVAEERLGPVDILINNASGWLQDSFAPRPSERFPEPHAVTAERWSRQFTVDARAPALLIAELARRHRERGARWGRIIGLTSGGALGFPNEVSYGAAKAAQTSYTMSAAAELAGLGITANVVHPPVTDTGWITDDVRQFVAASDEHVHVADPDEVAKTLAFLASEDADLVSGSVIVLR